MDHEPESIVERHRRERRELLRQQREELEYALGTDDDDDAEESAGEEAVDDDEDTPDGSGSDDAFDPDALDVHDDSADGDDGEEVADDVDDDGVEDPSVESDEEAGEIDDAGDADVGQDAAVLRGSDALEAEHIAAAAALACDECIAEMQLAIDNEHAGICSRFAWREMGSTLDEHDCSNEDEDEDGAPACPEGPHADWLLDAEDLRAMRAGFHGIALHCTRCNIWACQPPAEWL